MPTEYERCECRVPSPVPLSGDWECAECRKPIDPSEYTIDTVTWVYGESS